MLSYSKNKGDHSAVVLRSLLPRYLTKDLRFGLLENRRLLSRDIRQKMIFRPFFLIIFENTTLEVTLNLMELYTVADNDCFDAKRFPVYFGRIRSCTMALRTKSWACDCVTRPPVFF
jgi:hypothetical protein